MTENKDDENKIIIFSIQNNYFGKQKYSSAKSWINRLNLISGVILELLKNF
jgi:hypothetical protein